MQGKKEDQRQHKYLGFITVLCYGQFVDEQLIVTLLVIFFQWDVSFLEIDGPLQTSVLLQYIVLVTFVDNVYCRQTVPSFTFNGIYN